MRIKRLMVWFFLQLSGGRGSVAADRRLGGKNGAVGSSSPSGTLEGEAGTRSP